MLFQRLNREDAEKAFLIVKNINAATMVAGYSCVWDIVAPDGVRVEKPATATLSLFVGVVDDDIATNAYGLVQVYGYRASTWILGHASLAAGTILVPVDAQWYLTYSAAGDGKTGLAMAGEAYTTTSAANKKAFLRAL
jgi:hypothetical protein